MIITIILKTQRCEFHELGPFDRRIFSNRASFLAFAAAAF